MKNFVYIKSLITNNKFSNIEIYLYLAFIGLLSSLGSNVGNLNYDENGIIKEFIKLRSTVPWVILLINTVILAKLFIKNKYFNLNPIILFFLVYVIFQIIGCYLNNLEIFHFHFIVGSLSFISLILIILNTDRDYLLKIIKITLGLILIFVIFFLIQNPSISYGSGWINYYNDKVIILNSNGFSRYFVILYFFCFVQLFATKKNRFVLIILLIFIGTIINFYEGRFNIGTILLFSGIIFFKNISIINKITTYFFICIIPILLTMVISILIYSNLENIDTDNKTDNKNEKLNLLEKAQKIPTNRYSPNAEKYFNKSEYLKATAGDLEKFSTGRIGKWEIIVQHKQQNFNQIFGNGPEYDRKILQNVFHSGSDAANSLLYIYLSGGLISVVLILILSFNQLINLHRQIFKNNIIENKYMFFSMLVFVFIAARGLLENGFGAWGMDQILFILFGSIINLNFTKLKN
jgi:hypothetical protein